MTPTTPEISVVIPAFNEADNLAPLLAELELALAPTGREYELVLVDDGSDDGTGDRLLEAARLDPRIRPVRLAERSGQSSALAAGFMRVRGRVVVTLDADLQNDPADLPALLAALEDADVVSGIRQGRQDTWVRLVSSRIANGARRMVLGDRVTDIGCSFKAYRREALEGLPFFTTMHRFLPALCAFRGSRVVEVPVRHRARRHGLSKYGVMNRLGRGLADLVGVFWLRSRLVRYRVIGE